MRRKVDGIGRNARGAAQRRRVVLSIGSMDGVLLQALARVQLAATDGATTSTWADGIGDQAHQVKGLTDGDKVG